MAHSDEQHHRHIHLEDGDASVSAELITTAEGDGTAQVIVHARSGHLTPGLRRRLIDALLDAPEAHDSGLLAASIPLGDTESLRELTERCQDVVVRAAGSTALVDARLRHGTAR